MILVTLLLTIIAAVPRLYDLGSLGFYGDEETSAMPAYSLAQGNGIQMPSGMPYRRALPQTWLNSIFAREFGLKTELSYRIPAALIGTLTIPLLFLMSRPLVGTLAAFTAALLLSFSEWHIITSREARMYAPFLFFYTATGLTMWRWISTRQWGFLLLSAIFFAITISLHTLGLLAAIFAIIPIAFIAWSRIQAIWLLIIASATISIAHLYSKYFMSSGFNVWEAGQETLPPSPGHTADAGGNSWLPSSLASMPVMAGIGILVGTILGIWAARLSTIRDETSGAVLRLFGRYFLAVATGVFFCFGQPQGAILFGLLFVIIHPDSAITLIKKVWAPLVIMVSITAIWSIILISQHGLIAGIKMLVAFPFPYSAFLFQMFPGVFILFIGMCTSLALQQSYSKSYPLRAILLAVLIPLIAIGLVSKWGGMRYLIEIYPFLLILASTALVKLLSAINHHTTHWNKLATLCVVIAIVVSGILGGHGVPQALRAATLEYGKPENELALGFPFYPDHQAPGDFVRNHLSQKDIVIAEDALQQWWYIGRVDFWLRDPVSNRQFLYRTGQGQLRDIYVNSQIATANILNQLSKQKKRRIWIITSGETYHKWELYLSKKQQHWLLNIEKMQPPVFTGRDGVSNVYCLNCQKNISATIVQEFSTKGR